MFVGFDSTFLFWNVRPNVTICYAYFLTTVIFYQFVLIKRISEVEGVRVFAVRIVI